MGSLAPWMGRFGVLLAALLCAGLLQSCSAKVTEQQILHFMKDTSDPQFAFAEYDPTKPTQNLDKFINFLVQKGFKLKEDSGKPHNYITGKITFPGRVEGEHVKLEFLLSCDKNSMVDSPRPLSSVSDSSESLPPNEESSGGSWWSCPFQLGEHTQTRDFVITYMLNADDGNAISGSFVWASKSRMKGQSRPVEPEVMQDPNEWYPVTFIAGLGKFMEKGCATPPPVKAGTLVSFVEKLGRFIGIPRVALVDGSFQCLHQDHANTRVELKPSNIFMFPKGGISFYENMGYSYVFTQYTGEEGRIARLNFVRQTTMLGFVLFAAHRIQHDEVYRNLASMIGGEPFHKIELHEGDATKTMAAFLPGLVTEACAPGSQLSKRCPAAASLLNNLVSMRDPPSPSHCDYIKTLVHSEHENPVTEEHINEEKSSISKKTLKTHRAMQQTTFDLVRQFCTDEDHKGEPESRLPPTTSSGPRLNACLEQCRYAERAFLEVMPALEAVHKVPIVSENEAFKDDDHVLPNPSCICSSYAMVKVFANPKTNDNVLAWKDFSDPVRNLLVVPCTAQNFPGEDLEK